MNRIYSVRKLWFLLLFVSMFQFSGCKNKEVSPPSGPRLVTGIDISYRNGAFLARRSYTSPDKMEPILNYLRLIDPYGAPGEDPETIPGSDYTITVSYSDGSSTVYRQRADRFLQVGGAPWKKIDPNRGAELIFLISQLLSDQ